MLLNLFLSFLGGIFYAWGFPVKGYFSFFLFPIIGFALLFYCLNKYYENKRRIDLFYYVLAFDLGYFLLGFYWIITLLFNFGQITPPWNYFLAILSSTILTPHYIIFVLLYSFLSPRKSMKANSVNMAIVMIKKLLNHPIVLSMILVLLERIIPQEFPAHIGHPWLQISPYLGLAPIFGSGIYSFISYLIAIVFVREFLSGNAKIKKFSSDFWLSSSLIFSLILASFLIPLPNRKLKNKSIAIRVVQANIENDLKLQSEEHSNGEYGKTVRQIYKHLSTQDSNKKIDLIIWPETAYPKLLYSQLMKDDPRNTPQLIKDVIKQTKSFLITGGYDERNYNSTGFFETMYNSAFLFNPKQILQDVYYKHILIPFGETLPFGPLNNLFKNINSNISFFAKGKKYPFFQIGDATISMAICYEILYPEFLQRYFKKQKPDFIVNITNDSWYGDTSEPYQHLFLSRWRALEWQIPIVRVTNTGITALIKSDGSYQELIPMNKSFFKDITIKY